jgi:uncharacterized delta-60 repeat protein
VDGSFVPAVSPRLAVLGIAPQPDGRILLWGKAGGGEASVPPVYGVLRLQADGTRDPGFSVAVPPGGACGYVRCLAVQPDGRVLIGGEFDLPPRGLARLNADGTVDGSFHPPDLPAWDEEGVHALAVLADGRILIGGDLDGVSNGLPPALVRLNRDGSVDPTFDLGVDLHGGVQTIVPTPDGRWLVGGIWLQGGQGEYRSGLLRLRADGALDVVLSLDAASASWPLAVQTDGAILAGGSTVIRFNPDGARDDAFEVQLPPGSNVNALLLQGQDRLVLGGAFVSVNGVPADGLARIHLAPQNRLPFVERHVALGTRVELVAVPVPGTTGYTVEDRPSWGPAEGISHGGRYDLQTGKVAFGPFPDDAPRTLAYWVAIPPGSSGVLRFDGRATADGAVSPIVGDDSLRVWEFPPPPLWLDLHWRPLTGAWAIQVMGDTDAAYVVEAGDALSEWRSLGTARSPTGFSEILAPADPRAPARFYRARKLD